MEDNSFSNRTADYVWLLMLVSMFLMVRLCYALTQAVSPLVNMPFLASSLAFSLVYIWSRRNPSVKISLLGVVKWVGEFRLTTASPHRICPSASPCSAGCCRGNLTGPSRTS